MATDQDFGARVERMVRLRGKTKVWLAQKLGISKQAVQEIVTANRTGTRHREKIAQLLGVDLAWLIEGDEGLAPRHESPEGAVPDLVGVVTAGDGNVGDYIEPPLTPIPIPKSWKLIRVEGMSAYPVVYPKQLVFVDLDRATNPKEMTAEQLVDLHDNMVVCQVQRDGDPVRAYLKRFCHAPGAAGDFILASVDSGRSSPFIAPAEIFLITPVVGVLFQDPTKPRVKMNHAKTVIVDTNA